MLTFAMEVLATRAPTVSFVHSFPGPVKSNIARDSNMVNLVLRTIFVVIGPFIYIPNDESGDRHVFIATSERYPAASGKESVAHVGLEKGVTISRGTDAVEGSGMYTTDQVCEASGSGVEEMLARMREEHAPAKVWEHTEAEFMRMVGTKSMQ